MFCGAGVIKHEEDLAEENKKIQNYFYKPSSKIGEGNFSQVFKGIDQNTGKHVAIKVVKYSSLTTKVADQLLRNQIGIVKQLNHEYVIKCHDVFSSKNNCYIVTQFYEGGDLEKILFRNKFFHEKDLPRLLYQSYKGLLYLNQHHIVHRDFKPANIFLTSSGTVKIADFGFAVKSSKPFKDINIGSPIYMSPEGLLLHQYGPKTEVWAFGIMIYQLLHGETPLSRCKDQKQLKQKILLPPVYREGISFQLRKMIDLCLTVDPKHRIEMKQIAQTSYMAKLINQFEPTRLKDLTLTKTTAETSTFSFVAFVEQARTYEEALALLQYCRLIHKTSVESPSLIFSQWLLNLCNSLRKIKIYGGQPQRNENLLRIIHDYFAKYEKQHKDSYLNPSCQDFLAECQKILNKTQASINNSAYKTRLNNLTMLLRESEMLQKCIETNKISAYAKASQIQKYLDSQKGSKNSTQSNQFIFNK